MRVEFWSAYVTDNLIENLDILMKLSTHDSLNHKMIGIADGRNQTSAIPTTCR